MAAADTVTLKCQDDQTFTVAKAVMVQSKLVRNVLIDTNVDDSTVVELPPVPSFVMPKIIDWCTKHKDDPDMPPEAPLDEDDWAPKKPLEVPEWDKKFLAELELPMLYAVIKSSNFMIIERLFKYSCKHLADLIRDCKNYLEVREKFGIEGDFTPEEESKLIEENPWIKESLKTDEDKAKAAKGAALSGSPQKSDEDD